MIGFYKIEQVNLQVWLFYEIFMSVIHVGQETLSLFPNSCQMITKISCLRRLLDLQDKQLHHIGVFDDTNWQQVMTNANLSIFLTRLTTFHYLLMTLTTIGDHILLTLITLGEDILMTQMTLVKPCDDPS
jgi:hypothetical protein